MRNKIVAQDVLIEKIKECRKRGMRIVSTSGCFDILHAGHVMYLEEARERGDILIVLLNADSSVRMLKGPQRPVVPQEERAAVLAGLAAVDYVCVFSERTPCGLIGRLQPDIVVKGGDYRGQAIPEMETVQAYGGAVQYVSLAAGCSSTAIIEQIKRSM